MDYIAGKNSVLEALRTGRRKIFSVLIGRNASDLLVKEIVALARQKKIPIHEIAAEQLVHKTGVQTHQGVAAEVSGFPYVDLSEIIAASRKNPEGSFVVLLDEVQDPQNVGALIRTAHLTGAKGMVLMKHRAATINATVLKAASGAAEHLPIVQEVNLVNCINLLKNNDFFVVGAEGDSGEDLYHTTFAWPLALVLGGEEKGLRRLVRESCDALLAIPMEGKVGSYNVSVAGAMMMGEILRQKRA